MSIITQSAYSQQPINALPDTGFVGVGTTTPSCNFQVIGQSQISGNLTVDSSITIADSARIDNNLRVNGYLFVAKNAYITDSTFTTFVRTKRITPFVGDSLIILGDSSLVVNTNSHLIYPEADFDIPNPIIKGTGIGSPNITPKGDYSVAVGHRINIDVIAKNSIAIGTAVLPTGPYLQQYIPNSIMLGTNSNLPTLFISPANGINTIGKVGIGTTTPSVNYHTPNLLKLDVNGDARFYRNNNPNNYVSIGYDGANGIIDSYGDGNLFINYYSEKHVYIAKNLYVNEMLYAKKMKVQLPPFPDYVFEPNYSILSFSELRMFIEKNKHLPGLPCAKDIDKNGIEMGELQIMQIKKLEEAYLYILQQESRITKLERELNMLKKEQQK
jgi:hypothetical protein